MAQLGTFKVAAMKRDLVDEAVAALVASGVDVKGLPGPGDLPKTEIAAVVKVVERHYAASVPPNKLLRCDDCGGHSTEAHKVCPFCGADDDDPGDAGAAAQPEPARADPAPTVAAKDPEPAPRVEQVQSSSGADANVLGKDEPQKVVRVPREKRTKAPAANGAAKANGAAPAFPQESSPAQVIDGNGSVIGTTGGPLPAALDRPAPTPAKSLDEALRRWNRAQQAGAGAMWDLGRALVDMMEGKLYLERTTAEGKPRYDSWAAFVREELRITPRYSYDLIDTATRYRREDVAALGPTKCRQMLALPPAEAEALAKRAIESGMTRSVIAEEVARLTAGRPATTRDTGRKGPANKAGLKKGNKKPAPKGDAGTVVFATQRGRAAFLARPKTKGAPARAARTLADEPTLIIEGIGGASIRIVVQKNPKGDLVGAWSIDREST